jgi:hypothetical protein
MEHQVPQFIEVEDKLVGPLTFRQFIYLAGGGGICVALFLTLPFWFSVPLIIPIGAFSVSLAFYRVNNKPFAAMLESAFAYYTHAKLFLWKKKETRAEESESGADTAAAENVTRATPRLTSGKLHDLAWSLDVKNHGKPEEKI